MRFKVANRSRTDAFVQSSVETSDGLRRGFSALGGIREGRCRGAEEGGRQALENAVGLPEAEELVIDGLTIEEWQGLQDSLARS